MAVKITTRIKFPQSNKGLLPYFWSREPENIEQIMYKAEYNTLIILATSTSPVEFKKII